MVIRALNRDNPFSSGFVDYLKREVDRVRASGIQRKIDELIDYFNYLRYRGTAKEIMSELAFCILAANYSASRSLELQHLLHEKILDIGEGELALFLKERGHRFAEARARYIANARKNLLKIVGLIRSGQRADYIRRWLVENVMGVGMKVASHFLRNTGRFDVAILDYHILDFLEKHGVIVKPRTLTIKRYMEIEKILFLISERVGVEPGILDLYLWYMETGGIVK